MRDLLLNHNLAESTPGNEVRQVARVQTLTALRSLDAGRNRIVLQFLQDTHLVSAQNPIISLKNADLSNADLSGANLSDMDLNSATLTGAHLNGANLNGADLEYADLSDADLSDANLSDATLTSAFLGSTVMNDTILTRAHLNGAILTGAHLSGAHLSGADLNGALLTNADLSSTDLSDADLVTSSLTQPQLDTVQSCTLATLSTRLKCNHKTTITLQYWYTETTGGNTEEAHVILTLIDRFNEQHRKFIHINPVYINYFQAETKFENMAKEGKAPDVLRSDVSWVAQFASQGYLLNIDSYTPQSYLSGYLSTPLSYDYYNNHLYGLPQVTDFLALLYNKAKLEKAHASLPSAMSDFTMTDFERDAREVVQSGAARYGFETDGTGYNVLPFLYTFGGGMLGQDNKILVNDPGSVAGLNFLLGLQKARLMPANVNYSNGPTTNIVSDFMKGRTAMIFGGPYNVPQILAGPGSVFENNHNNLGIAGIPTCPSADWPTWLEGPPTCRAGYSRTPSGGQSYVISADTLHPIEADKFISFMSQTPQQVAIAEANQTLPTRKSAYQNAVTSGQFLSEFLPITRTAVAQPAVPQVGAGHLFDALTPSIADALDGVQSPTAALNAVADDWRQLLTGS